MKDIIFGDFIVQDFITGTDGAGNFVGQSYCVFDQRDSRYVVWGLAVKEKAIKIAKRHYRARKLQNMVKRFKRLTSLVKRLIGRK